MKTLPRKRAAHAVDARASPGDFSNQYVISQPGRIITTNTSCWQQGRNRDFTNNVTLDLNGFPLVVVQIPSMEFLWPTFFARMCGAQRHHHRMALTAPTEFAVSDST